MRERSDGAGEADVGSKGESKRIDLSVPQVAGSALAAVVAAKLASSFGVYGTIVGAGLISVVATCGGSVLQHFFKRTGEQIRVKRTVATVRTGGRAASVSDAVPASASGPGAGPEPGPGGGFTAGTVYRARVKSWRRPLVAAALVFGVTMAGITAYEVASGQSLSGGHSTTVGSAFTGHNKSATDSGGSGDSDGSGGSDDAPDGRGPEGPGDTGDSKDSGSGSDAPTSTPSGSADGGAAENGGTDDGGTDDGGTENGGAGSSPAPTPDATGDEGAGDSATPDPGASATAPAPGASSRSGTDAPGQDGPAAP
ncbi:ATP-binding protein OS=Streptomyces tendae OX=1932 GN=GUR47_35005 PE=4 SV=1 [Streptomyces tendae]